MQRVRNRLIEYLTMIVFYETQPPPFDLNEALNQWEDWVTAPASSSHFPSPVYTSTERDLLVLVGNEWESFCNATPKIIRDEHVELQRAEWVRLQSAARAALIELRRRGGLADDVEA